MNRITSLLKSKKDILSIYYTAGYPNINDTLPILESLEKSGVDMVEIGIPFSDPLADGPVIQASSLQAINNGMTLKKLFEQLESLPPRVTIPVVLMGYFNTVIQYGTDRFINDCKRCGVDGVILPDLPFDEYIEKYKPLFSENNISFIPLIAPQTPDERIRHIDKNTSGFIYVVASPGITGNITTTAEYKKAYFNRIKNLNLNNNAIIGFGINSAQTFDEVCRYADGGIIGTAFIKHITENGADTKSIEIFIKSIKTKANKLQNAIEFQ